jgi:predicted AlkP superfamily pyrophosphatase or phosphodiesterase
MLSQDYHSVHRASLLRWGRMRIFPFLRFIQAAAATVALLPVWPAAAQTAARPKLVVGIVIDQFRYDYLTRFRAKYHGGGLERLLNEGAVFTNAYYQQSPTVTAVGHSIFMSGAMPSTSGIVNNAWYDRGEGQVVTSVCDWNEQAVGGQQPAKGPKCTDADPASARRLLVSTLGDELRNASQDSKVIGISIKSRSAILPAGHRANAAYWFDDVTGNFVSSTYYIAELPAWAQDFNARKLAAEYPGKKWDGFPNWDFHPDPGSAAPFNKLPASPWGNELIERFAEEAIRGEQLGQRGATDLLTVSFSSNDYVGHRVGPDAPEVEDMSVRTDALLGRLFRLLDEKVGLANVVIALTADHGVAPAPAKDEQVQKARRMPGGYLRGSPEDVVRSALVERFGKADWLISGGGETSIYLNTKTLAEFKTADGRPLDRQEVLRVARDALLAKAALHVARVYTSDQLAAGVTGDFVAQAFDNGFYARRCGDLMLVFDPYFIPGSAGTTHFSPWGYDRHVPVIFFGFGIRPGRYNQTIAVNDIAPTLATLLDIETPSGSAGHVLAEILK